MAMAIPIHGRQKLPACILSISFEAFRCSFIFTDTSNTYHNLIQWIQDNVSCCFSVDANQVTLTIPRHRQHPSQHLLHQEVVQIGNPQNILDPPVPSHQHQRIFQSVHCHQGQS